MFFDDTFSDNNKNFNSYTLEELKTVYTTVLNKYEDLNKTRVQLVRKVKSIEEEMSSIRKNYEIIQKELDLRITSSFYEKIDEILREKPNVFNTDEVRVIKCTKVCKPLEIEFAINETIKLKSQYKNWKLVSLRIYSLGDCDLNFEDENQVLFSHSARNSSLIFA